MARTALTVSKVSLAGLDVDVAANGTAGDVANGNVVEGNDGERVFVIVANTSADTAYDVTFVTPGTVGAQAHTIEDEVIEVAFGDVNAYGPFPLSEYTKDLQINVENAALKLKAIKI